MKGFLCWLQHRDIWVTIIPGLLPAKIDGIHFCPLCRSGGEVARHRQVAF